MIDLSLNEVETLAAKVGRGAGYSWGLSEEFSRGARRLAEAGLPWARALFALAEGAAAWRAPSRVDVEAWRGGGDIGAPGTLCPVRTAALLLDEPALLAGPALRLGKVGLPIWLAGLVSAREAAVALTIAWGDASALATDVGVLARADADALLAPSADVTIAHGAAPAEKLAPARRALAEETILAALQPIAARVYVPASAISRARGAGGGSVDDD